MPVTKKNIKSKKTIKLKSRKNINTDKHSKSVLTKSHTNTNINTNNKSLSINYDYDKINECLKGIDVVYYINLDRSTDRRQNAENLLKDIKIPNVRISAIDGVMEDNKIFYNRLKNAHKLQNWKLSKIEYACLLSHLETIKIFSNSKYETALILEDDFSLEFSKFWNKSIKEIINNAPKDWEIIMLGFSSFKHNDLEADYTLNYSGNKKIYGTFSYLINKKGAKKLMNSIYFNKKYNLDLNIFHHADIYIYTKLITYVYKYPYFTYPTYNTTLIHNDHLIQHIYSKIYTLMYWLGDLKSKYLIYKYKNFEATDKFVIDIEIYDTTNYFIGLFYNNKIKSEIILILQEKEITNDFLYIKRVFGNKTISFNYNKNDLLNTIKNIPYIDKIKNYIDKNLKK